MTSDALDLFNRRQWPTNVASISSRDLVLAAEWRQAFGEWWIKPYRPELITRRDVCDGLVRLISGPVFQRRVLTRIGGLKADVVEKGQGGFWYAVEHHGPCLLGKEFS